MTAKRILSLLIRRRKRLPDAVFANRLAIARHYIRCAGDEVRDLNRWRDGYRLRTGRAA